MLLNDLHELTLLLSKKEIKELKQKISAEKREFVLSGKLFNTLLLYKDCPPDSEINTILYSQKIPCSEQGHKKLLLRLRTKIIEVFYDCKYENSDEIDTIDHAFFKVNKLIGQVHALQIRGCKSKLIIKLRDEIIKTAIKYEFYDVLIEQLEIKKISQIFLHGPRIINPFNEKIHYYRECQDAIFLAYEFDSLLKYNSGKFSTDSLERLKEVEANMNHLLELYKKLKSPILQYFYLFHEFYLLNEKRNYLKAGQVGLAILALVHNSPSLKRRYRISHVNGNLGLNKILQGEYKDSIVYSNGANQIFKKGTKSYYLTVQNIFFASFYNNDLEKAERCVHYMRQKGKGVVNAFEYGKIDAYQAYIYFAKGNYVLALEKLLRLKEVLEDTAGWGFTIRVFTIMIFLIQDKEDLATVAFENLKRQFYRISKNQELRKRDLVIYQILLGLSKEGFNLTNPEKIIFLKRQLEKNPANEWEHITAELIPFEKLLEKKYPATECSRSANIKLTKKGS